MQHQLAMLVLGLKKKRYHTMTIPFLGRPQHTRSSRAERAGKDLQRGSDNSTAPGLVRVSVLIDHSDAYSTCLCGVVGFRMLNR